jgi:hypothetical protein
MERSSFGSKGRLTVLTFRRAVCIAAAAASLTATVAPAASAQSHGNGDCKDPITGQTIRNGKWAYHWQYDVNAAPGHKMAIVVVGCKNGKLIVETVDDPDSMY